MEETRFGLHEIPNPRVNMMVLLEVDRSKLWEDQKSDAFWNPVMDQVSRTAAAGGPDGLIVVPDVGLVNELIVSNLSATMLMQGVQKHIQECNNAMLQYRTRSEQLEKQFEEAGVQIQATQAQNGLLHDAVFQAGTEVGQLRDDLIMKEPSEAEVAAEPMDIVSQNPEHRSTLLKSIEKQMAHALPRRQHHADTPASRRQFRVCSGDFT